jgi:hypothetical protein
VAGAHAAAPADRVAAHHAVGALAQAAGHPGLAAAMLDSAVTLLPSVAPREAGWADQQHRIGEHAGLVETAVAAHCAVADPAGAVKIAELGRGVLLASQANIRADLAELDNRNARLAARFRWVCERLNTPDFPADERKRWWADYDTLLASIRELPGLGDFLAAPPLADLRPAAAGGYVVLVNSSGSRGDAVVVRADSDPVSIRLPGLRLTDAEIKVAALLEAFDEPYSLLVGRRRRRVTADILGWLWDTTVAYLSACSTANHGTRYADEVLHLASAFQLAGFRHVIASLWQLDDDTAAEAARSFYRELPRTPVADDAAVVLRKVTLRLRDQHPDRPELWAPLIHSGP